MTRQAGHLGREEHGQDRHLGRPQVHDLDLNKNGKLNEELCVVPFSSLPGKEDFEKTFKELAESFEGMTKGLPGAGDSAKARNSINGYPVRTRFFEAGRRRTRDGKRGDQVGRRVGARLPRSKFRPATRKKKCRRWVADVSPRGRPPAGRPRTATAHERLAQVSQLRRLGEHHFHVRGQIAFRLKPCPQPVSRITGVAGDSRLDRARDLPAIDVRHAEIRHHTE